MIKELYLKRKQLVDQMKDNNYNASEIIANLYSDISHFIYELLQNAEDSEASFINFELQENSLCITHNGKLFNKNDVDAITTIGFSTKKDDLTKIGKFGAGFKSVFAFTNTPKIYSGDLSFEIQEYIIPQEIPKIQLEHNLTAIELPFNSQKIDSQKAFKIISDKLLNLESESLLFLKNIQIIRWSFVEQKGSFKKEQRSSNKCQYIDIITTNNETSETKSYIKNDKTIQIDNKNLTLSIAYAMQEGKIVPIENSLLSVFFPTKVNTYYKFLLQAPYKTTPNRENIPFEDKDNQIITAELSKLVGESFLILKEENLYNIDFLENMIMNTKYYSHLLYMAIFNELIKSFRTYELLPTSHGIYCKSADLTLAYNDELIKLLENDIKKYTAKEYFFMYKYGNEFTRYLNSILGIQVFSNDEFLLKLTNEDLKQKDNDWLILFYNFLAIQNFNKHYLTITPIMKLSDSSFVPLYKNIHEDKPQVYLPTEKTSKFKTLHTLFTDNPILKNFIEKYKIIKPNKIAELKEFILPKYLSTPKVSCEEYIEDFNFIVDIYNNANQTDKAQIENLCKDKFLVKCINDGFYQAQFIYFETKELQKWFSASSDVKFIHSSINSDNAKAFLQSIGINTKPRFLSQALYIDGLKSNLENISFDNSIMLWDYFIKHLTNFYITKDEESMRYSTQTIQYLKIALKDTSWLKSKKESEFLKPSEIIFQDLDSRYTYPDTIKEYLIIDIKFKPNKIQQIEEELDCKIVNKNEFEEFQRWKDTQKKENKENFSSDYVWSFDTKAIAINSIKVHTYKNDLYYTKTDLSYQKPSAYESDSFKTSYTNYNSVESRKAIGDWGEEFVNNYLQHKYKNQSNITIKWLNQNNFIGVGYDFVILENNIEIEYIEVKSKVSYYPSMIEVSGTQWTWARELYEQNNGEKFKIYLVLGAGKDNAYISVIENPIKQWIDGDLKVHPVNIEL
jgi:hypothetical protein